MKKRLLLPFLFLAIMFTGCQEPDEDVDMPVPEEPVAERILGDWDLINLTGGAADSSGSYPPKTDYNPNLIYHIGKEFVDFEEPGFEPCYCGEGYDDTALGWYIISESNGKTYIEGTHAYEGFKKYEITQLSDSLMVWEMNDSLAALSDSYNMEHYPYGYREEITMKRIK